MLCLQVGTGLVNLKNTSFLYTEYGWNVKIGDYVKFSMDNIIQYMPRSYYILYDTLDKYFVCSGNY